MISVPLAYLGYQDYQKEHAIERLLAWRAGIVTAGAPQIQPDTVLMALGVRGTDAGGGSEASRPRTATRGSRAPLSRIAWAAAASI
jgi:hypothetical protein